MAVRVPIVTPVAVNRLQLPVTTSLDDFRARYERAVPALDFDQVADFVARRAPWAEMLEFIGAAAPFGFLIYWKNQADEVMRLAGDTAPCVAYLMGNHTIAERMFRHNPAAMLYAPLRTVLWQDSSSQAWFAVDQPSTQFGSFSDPRITATGRDLDAELAVLLAHLGLDVPPALLPVDLPPKLP